MPATTASVIRLGDAPLTPAQIAAVARHDARVELSDDALARIAKECSS